MFSRVARLMLLAWGILLSMAVGVSPALAQTCTAIPATLGGNATLLASNEIQLTPASNSQLGTAWMNAPLDLTKPFDMSFNLYLGNNDAGADGIAFVIRSPSSASAGKPGRGMGAGDDETSTNSGISPSVVVEFDTYRNADVGWADPAADHTAIYLNGDGTHNASHPETLTGAIALPNLENNAYHTFRITWNPVTKNLVEYVDGTQRASITLDIIATLGTSSPLWGFTGSTGGLNNRQAICNQNPVADVSVTKTDSVTSVPTGGTTTYTITATNNGPSSVTGTILSDPATAGLTVTSVACGPTPGQCTAGTTPTIAQLQGTSFGMPTLASGQTYRLVVTATVTAAAGGSVSNVVSVTNPTTVLEGSTTNNSATDTNTVTPAADLAI